MTKVKLTLCVSSWHSELGLPSSVSSFVIRHSSLVTGHWSLVISDRGNLWQSSRLTPFSPQPKRRRPGRKSARVPSHRGFGLNDQWKRLACNAVKVALAELAHGGDLEDARRTHHPLTH